MPSSALRRTGRSAGILVLALGSGLSAAPLDSFVASGGYARALAAAADCETTFIPNLSLDEGAADGGVGFRRAGADLRYMYEPVTDTAGRVRHEYGDPVEALLAGLPAEAAEARDAHGELPPAHLIEARSGRRLSGPAAGDEPDLIPGGGVRESEGEAAETAAAASRTDVYTSPEGVETRVVSTVEASGCTKLVLAGATSMQIGIQGGGVLSVAHRNSSGRYRNLRSRNLNPKDFRQNLRIRVLRDGRPVQQATVRLWVDPIGDYTRFGVTPGHWHIWTAVERGETVRPTIQIGEFNSDTPKARGAQLTAKTDNNGEWSPWVQAGYRGGVESIRAQWVDGPTPASRATARLSVAARHRSMVHFASLNGFSSERPPEPSRELPFLLVGHTTKHRLSHFIQPQLKTQANRILRTVWEGDLTPAEKAAALADVRSRDAHWIQPNDMSLEYGGLFRVGAAHDCDDPTDPGSPRGHITHNIGQDIDMAPCYSNGMGRVTGADCNAGGAAVRRVNRDRLQSQVEGLEGGSIYLHTSGGKITHYHIRLPGADTYEGWEAR